jgi:3-oxoacyl-[acyl-carrier protein] reductase
MVTGALSGRGAIVTGASRGLGLEIARSYLREGAHVLMTARDEVRLAEARAELAPLAAAGQVLATVPGDVGRAEDCARVVAHALTVLPDLTVLVNNAGVYGPMGRIEDVDWDEWVDAVRIDLFGTVLMCRAVIPHLRRRGYGKIVNLSGGGATAPLPRISAYAAAKVAVVRLTETFAQELEDAHVDVNAIAPGALNTRLLDEVLAAGPDKVGAAFHERSLKQLEEGGAPLAKGAALAVFLASARSDGISGRLLSAIWDDWARLPEERDALAKSETYTLRRVVPPPKERA